MNSFRNILFVSGSLKDEKPALKQALSLARNNQAALKVLLVCPPTDSLGAYREKYLDGLKLQLREALRAASAEIKAESETADNIPVELISTKTPAVDIIRHVLQNGHDLIIKNAEKREDGKGFLALDMDLLRKCPCPAWLCRPIERSRHDIRIAVAIDPESEEKAGHNLSLSLLRMARPLADHCDGQLRIISCWDFPFEEYMRGNPWAKRPEDEIAAMVRNAQDKHRAALEAVIAESGIDGNTAIHHVRGRTAEAIPNCVLEEEIDILIMGTVARTGIPGITMGNTSENICHKLECSLLAMKPPGFVSPVKAY